MKSMWLYNCAIAGYSTAARVASLRSAKVADMLAGQRITLDTISKARREVAPDGFDFWFHAASLGEFEQARPVMEALRTRIPDCTILLSFFSPSGFNVRCEWPGADCIVYLPFDRPYNAKSFIEAAQPKCSVFVKYEFWANYLHELHTLRIPTFIISSIFRPDQPFFKPWGGLWRKMLACFDTIFVQDEASRRLLADIGFDGHTVVAGDTRFDRVATIRQAAKNLPEVELFCKGQPRMVVVGSSWPADEDIYIPWLKLHPDTGCIIAPHEFDSDRLEQLRNRLGLQATVLYSELTAPGFELKPEHRYLIIDCFGLLSSIYRYGSVAVVGGGFGAGIHNINEAAVYGMPVLFGPKHHKFREAAELIDCGGGFCYSDATVFADTLNRLLDNSEALNKASEAAERYIESNIGATERILPSLLTCHQP